MEEHELDVRDHMCEVKEKSVAGGVLGRRERGSPCMATIPRGPRPGLELEFMNRPRAGELGGYARAGELRGTGRVGELGLSGGGRVGELG
eukprot:3933533-Heterocapsa_arctica.AAC.2